MNAICLHEGTLSIGGRTIFRGVDLEVGYGEIVVLTGPNGSGKSCLTKILATIIRDFSGKLWLKGRPVHAGIPEEQLYPIRKEIGYVGQSALVELSASCWANVYHTTLFRGVPSHRRILETRRALVRTGLWNRRNEPAGNLNGGDKTWLTLAQSLAGTHSGFLFADELAANLSTENAGRLADLFRQLANEEQYTIVTVTHNEAWGRQLNGTFYHLNEEVLDSRPPANGFSTRRSDAGSPKARRMTMESRLDLIEFQLRKLREELSAEAPENSFNFRPSGRHA